MQATQALLPRLSRVEAVQLCVALSNDALDLTPPPPTAWSRALAGRLKVLEAAAAGGPQGSGRGRPKFEVGPPEVSEQGRGIRGPQSALGDPAALEGRVSMTVPGRKSAGQSAPAARPESGRWELWEHALVGEALRRIGALPRSGRGRGFRRRPKSK